MPKPTRTKLIMKAFAAIPAGEPLNVGEIVDGLLHHGHDFDGVTTERSGQESLTERALVRLVAQGKLAVDEHGERATWYVPTTEPDTNPEADVVTAATGSPTGSGQAQDEASWFTKQNLFAATFTVAVLGLIYLIVLIGVANS